jgi:hypothetical protein
MRTIFTALLTVWVLLIAATGWCCHRPCDCAQPSCAVTAHSHPCCDASPQPSTCGHGNGYALPASNTSGTPCEHDKCAGACTYLPAKPHDTEIDPILTCPYSTALTFVPMDLTRPMVLGGDWVCDLVLITPPSRLHQLHRVWLI